MPASFSNTTAILQMSFLRPLNSPRPFSVEGLTGSLGLGARSAGSCVTTKRN